MSPQKFSILASEFVINTPFYKLEKQEVLVPDGSKVDWYIQRHSDVVVVIPKSNSGEFLLQKNYKPVLNETVLEFCTGIIDDAEAPEEAALRELKEETGCTCKHLNKIGEVLAAPNGNDITYHLFLAHDCLKTESTSLDTTEQIEPFWLKGEGAVQSEIKANQPQVTAVTLAAWGAYKML